MACGFDVLGMCLGAPGDEVLARISSAPGISIESIHGDAGRLPSEPLKNAAGAAALAVLTELGASQGVELELRKGLPLAAGMGGSAASAVAAAVAVDGLLQGKLSPEALLRCALSGEAVAAGAAHPDNAAASLLGGIVLVPTWEPVRAIGLPVPEELAVVLIHPHLEVETAAAREILGDSVGLADATAQWGNTAALVTGLFRRDWELISRAVVDRVAEPLRAGAVPGFQQAKEAALECGALAASLSGSGPSVFALCRGRDRAEAVGAAVSDAFRSAARLSSEVVVAVGPAPGARILPALD
jgi:homoserine kinase